MISLGCAKNLVDAEIMLGSVLERGMEITSSAEDADVLVINTCAFIDSAKEESIDAILEAHQQRGLHKRANQRLIVSGCMSQRFSEELRQQLPEVDAFIGLDQVRELGTVVERVLQKHRTSNAENSEVLDFVTPRPTYIPDYDTPRFRLTPPHSAYLKIAEGCNHPCSFCVIPQMRGRHRSRTAGISPFRDSRTCGRRSARNQFYQPGHDLLRDGFVDGKSRAASTGRFGAGADIGFAPARG